MKIKFLRNYFCKKIYYLFFAYIICCSVFFVDIYGEEIQFLAGVDKATVSINEEVKVTLLIIGYSEIVEPPTLEYENLRLISSPQQIVSIDLDTEQKKLCGEYIYRFKCEKVGVAIIKSIIFRNENTHHQPDILINVIPEKSEEALPFWVDLKSSSLSLYEKEITNLDVIYYHPYNINLDDHSFEFKDSTDYQILKIVPVITKEYERKENFIYRKISHRYKVAPLTSGRIKMELEYFHSNVYVKSSKISHFDDVFGKNDFFEDDFFRKKPLNDDFGGEKIKISLKSPNLFLEVKELPKTSENFIGIIGSFTAKFTSETLKGNLIQLDILFLGEGNLEFLKKDFYQANQNIKVLHTNLLTTKYVDSESNPPHVTRTAQVTIEVLKNGNFQLNPNFYYFDLIQKKYSKIKVPSLNFTISLENNSDKTINIWFSFVIFGTLIFIVISTIGYFLRKKLKK